MPPTGLRLPWPRAYRWRQVRRRLPPTYRDILARPLILLGGPDVELNELTALAKTLGGKAFNVERPEKIGGIFLRAHLSG